LAPCSCDVVAVGGALEPCGRTAVRVVESLLTSPCFRKGLRAAVDMEHAGRHHYLFTGASRVGRGGVRRLPGPRPSLSPGVGRGGVHRLPEPRPGPSPRVGRGGVCRLPGPRPSPSPGVGQGGVHRLPEPRPSPSPGVGQGGVSYGAQSQTRLLSASLCRAAQQSERCRRRCPLVRPVSGAVK
jgi:hypothetical protein